MGYKNIEKFMEIIKRCHLEHKIMLFLSNPLNSDIDRVIYITKYLKKFNLLPQIIKTCKNNNLSTRYRNEGNVAFYAQDWQNARILYTKSIAYAEIDKSTECLATAYANRSAVLYQMAYYEECIKDIDKAIELDYPREKTPKLLVRKSKAESLRKLTKPYNFYNDISNDISESIKSKIQLNSDTEKNRYIVATRDIEPGEFISIEEPYVTSLDVANFEIMLLCHHCSNYTLNLIPCDQCPFTLFCNENCKQQAWTYHQFECPLMQTLYEANVMEFFLLLRIVIISIKNDLQNTIKLMEEEDDVYKFGIINENEQGIFELQSNYAAIHYFDPKTEKRSVNELLLHYTAASILWNLLKQTQFFRTVCSLSEERMSKLVANLLVRHSQSHKFYSQKILSLLNTPDVMLSNGMGVYPFHGLLSHSCDPNVFQIFYGNKLTLRALRPIKKGNRLYGSRQPRIQYMEMDRDSRRHRLSLVYYFDCKCKACVENWSTLAEIKINPNVPFECRQLVTLTISSISRIDDLIRDRKKFKTYLPEFQKFLKQLEKKYKPCFEYSTLQRGLEMICTMEGNIMLNFKIDDSILSGKADIFADNILLKFNFV